MAKFNFVTIDKQFIISLVSTEDYENPISLITFLSPTFEVKGNNFKFFENGIYKKSINFNDFELIGDVYYSDLQEAIDNLRKEILKTKE